jgi:hypothetical protein
MKRYRFTFEFFDTVEQAMLFCDNHNKNASYYIRKKKPAHVMPWSGEDGTEHKYIVTYYT